MRIGFVGLGKMGSQMVNKLQAAGHELVVMDINQEAVEKLVGPGITGAADRQALAQQLPSPAIIWLMIPAEFVQPEIEAFAGILPSGSIIIDGGNSDYHQTLERAKLCANKNVNLVDVGTSGGILGLANGFSMMVGGADTALASIEPILKALSEPRGAYHHFGPTGTGHYVKMVHNGIEYGLMQAYAEGYDLLMSGPLENIDLAAVAEVWQHGSIVSSELNELIQRIYKQNPDLVGIEGVVDESGEGQWTKDTAEAAQVPTPALDAALKVRADSQRGQVNGATKLLAAMRHAFGGHDIHKQS